MKHTYKINGMTCENCAVKVKSALLTLPDVISVSVDKPTDTAEIEMQNHISIEVLNQKVKSKDDKYSIQVLDRGMMDSEVSHSLTQYKPIFLVFAYILCVTLIAEFRDGHFDSQNWMRYFMAGFFLCFSFFKMLDLSGFADSYMSYDIIAKRWREWGYVYAFIELGLGIAYLLNCCLLATNITAFIVMTISIIGVLQSVLNKRKIQCACLGAVFDLPMSTITIIEDALMIMMSGYMINTLL